MPKEPLNPVQKETPPKPRAEIVRSRITRLPKLTFWRRLLRNILRILARFVVWLFLDVQTRGIENIPLQGAILAVFNHLGDADVIVTFAKMPRTPEFIPKSEFYDLPILGKIMDAYGVIWVHRGQPDRNALRAALAGLSEERLIMVAPEGRESLTGGLEEGTHGAAYLALKSGSSILPIALTGTENKFVYKDLLRLGRTKVTMTIGPTFHLEQLSSRRESLHYGTRRIMETLADQLPPEYRGVYSTEAVQSYGGE